MTRAKQQSRETKTQELSQPELNEVTGGIIAVLPQNAQNKAIIAVKPQQVTGDGSVKPA
jgi:hypothetical protein